MLLKKTVPVFWRSAYEQWAVVGWLVAILCMFVTALTTDLPPQPFYYMSFVAVLYGAWALRDTLSLWVFKISLAGRAFVYISADAVHRRMQKYPHMLWFGFGFDWQPIHTQRAAEIRQLNIRDHLPPNWFLKAMGIAPQDAMAIGAPWLHGVEPKEEDVYIPLNALEGHTAVIGTTGSGKTRMYETLIFQSVMRGDIVFVIDPKGDSDLRQVVEDACIRAGRPDAFLFFHPAFPSKSIRLDPLKNWNRATSIASRIAALLPGNGDSFVQFAWRTINLLAEALVYIEDRPNLKKLRYYIEGSAHPLMEEVLRTYFTRHVPDWEVRLSRYRQKFSSDNKVRGPVQNGPRELQALVSMYIEETAQADREPAVDGLLSMVQHDQQHFSKMIQNVLPLLSSLTSGDIGNLLSPDASDIDDTRPIFDSDKIIKGGHVVYLGLDSLSDVTVSGAIASISLADLAAVAGDIYNYGGSVAPGRRIALFIDEAAEAVNVPLVQILNKGRGAGFVVTLATQTYPDFVDKLGSKERADMILGNCNNLIALRTKCTTTQRWIADQFGETSVEQRSYSSSAGARGDDVGFGESESRSVSVSRKEAMVFPPALLGMLPNLHYMALVAGGRVIKGRLAKINC